MTKPTKRGPKKATEGTEATAFSPSRNESEKKSQEIPLSFTQVPSSLEHFVKPLSRKHIYLVHLDTQARSVKQHIFILPLLLNLLITALVGYRAYAGAFTYPDIFRAVIGQPSPVSIDTATATWPQIINTMGGRTLTFFIDYFLATLFLPWPIRFVTGPLQWRRKLGFQNVEVVVRKSREWTGELQGEPRDWIRGNGDANKAIREKILPNMTPVRLQTKTGFLLIDADWDLDFDAMLRAHKTIDERRGNESKRRQHFEPFLSSVLVYGGDSSGWLVWRLEQDEDDITAGDGDQGLSPSQRDRILLFKKKLTDMGKEDLFFRWVELVQYESTQKGGFTPERQRKAMEDVKGLFEKEGVDFEKFWADVGGMEGVTLDK